MKRFFISWAALLVFTLLASPLQAQQQRGKGGGKFSGNRGSVEDARTIARMWEEEKLARDVYRKLASTWKLPVFQNISRAEHQHMQAIARLGGGQPLQFGDPNQDRLRDQDRQRDRVQDVPGQFAFPEYQQLYTQLVAQGTRSPLDALMVGAKIEEMDIADLRRSMGNTTDPQVRSVYARLLQGSQNHLRAFAYQLGMAGGHYKAEHLSQADFDAIANSSQNGAVRGNAGQRSGNMGNGFGRGSGSRGGGRGRRGGR